jgi:signal peptidase II
MQKGQDKGHSTVLCPDKIGGFIVDKDNSKLSLRDGIKKVALCLLVIASIIASDQLSKLWIRTNLTIGESLPLIGRLSLIHIGNTGSAFGLLANQTFLIIVTSIAALLFIMLFLRYLSPATTLSIVSIGLIMSGALGNLIDRLRFGSVTDFIYFRLWGNFHWPAFNIADASIVVGVCLLIYSFYRSGVFSRAYEHNHEPQN